MIWLADKLLGLRSLIGGALKALGPLGVGCIAFALIAVWQGHEAKVWKAKATACQVGRDTDRKAYTDAQQEAVWKATDAKRAEEARTAQIKREQADAIAKAHTDNRAYLARWVREHAAPARNPGSADLPATTVTPGSPDEAITAAIVSVSDLERCTDAVTLAEGWQHWWSAIEGKPK